MSTILWSIGGIVLLIALSFFCMRIEVIRNSKWRRKIYDFRERTQTTPSPKIPERGKKYTADRFSGVGNNYVTWKINSKKAKPSTR